MKEPIFLQGYVSFLKELSNTNSIPYHVCLQSLFQELMVVKGAIETKHQAFFQPLFEGDNHPLQNIFTILVTVFEILDRIVKILDTLELVLLIYLKYYHS